MDGVQQYGPAAGAYTLPLLQIRRRSFHHRTLLTLALVINSSSLNECSLSLSLSLLMCSEMASLSEFHIFPFLFVGHAHADVFLYFHTLII